MSIEEILEKVQRGEHPDFPPATTAVVELEGFDGFRDLLQMLWAPDPSTRPAMRDVARSLHVSEPENPAAVAAAPVIVDEYLALAEGNIEEEDNMEFSDMSDVGEESLAMEGVFDGNVGTLGGAALASTAVAAIGQAALDGTEMNAEATRTEVDAPGATPVVPGPTIVARVAENGDEDNFEISDMSDIELDERSPTRGRATAGVRARALAAGTSGELKSIIAAAPNTGGSSLAGGLPSGPPQNGESKTILQHPIQLPVREEADVEEGVGDEEVATTNKPAPAVEATADGLGLAGMLLPPPSKPAPCVAKSDSTSTSDVDETEYFSADELHPLHSSVASRSISSPLVIPEVAIRPPGSVSTPRANNANLCQVAAKRTSFSNDVWEATSAGDEEAAMGVASLSSDGKGSATVVEATAAIAAPTFTVSTKQNTDGVVTPASVQYAAGEVGELRGHFGKTNSPPPVQLSQRANDFPRVDDPHTSDAAAGLSIVDGVSSGEVKSDDTVERVLTRNAQAIHFTTTATTATATADMPIPPPPTFDTTMSSSSADHSGDTVLLTPEPRPAARVTTALRMPGLVPETVEETKRSWVSGRGGDGGDDGSSILATSTVSQTPSRGRGVRRVLADTPSRVRGMATSLLRLGKKRKGGRGKESFMD